METLKDKIASLEHQIEVNLATIDAIKAETDAKIATIKEDNKKLVKVVKKLKDTEAQIESIFSDTEKSE
jgi:L-serine deaminase